MNHAVQEPKAIAKAPEGEGCPRCGGYVYAAEQMLARGRVSILTVPTLKYMYNWGFLPSRVRLDTCIFLNIRSYYTMQHNWVAVVIFFTRVMKAWQIMTSNDSITAMKSILDSLVHSLLMFLASSFFALEQGLNCWNLGYTKEGSFTERQKVMTSVLS